MSAGRRRGASSSPPWPLAARVAERQAIGVERADYYRVAEMTTHPTQGDGIEVFLKGASDVDWTRRTAHELLCERVH